MPDSTSEKLPSLKHLAYQLWEARGRPQGSAESDWLDAERQLSAQQRSITRTADAVVETALLDTFPASDPPASHLPDTPPSNASEKWEAAGRARIAGAE